MLILYDTPGLTISHDAASYCLQTTWHGHHDGPSKRQSCETILQYVRQTSSSKILSDGSQDLDGWRAAVQWLGNEYYYDMAANGIVALAWVLPRNLSARTDVDGVLHLISRPHRTPQHPVIVDTFADVEAAYSWLQTVAVPT